MKTVKDLTVLIKRIIDEEFQSRGISQYKEHSVASTSDRRKSFVESTDGINDSIRAIIKKPQIISGLKVLSTEPSTMKIKIESGEYLSNGKHVNFHMLTDIEVPFHDEPVVWYVQLDELSQVKFNLYASDTYVNVAKIVIPSKYTQRICQYKDFNNPDSVDGWIVLPSDPYFINSPTTSEREVAIMRYILGERIIGEIVVSEGLKVRNAVGTVDINSRSINIYDGDGNKFATFGRDILGRNGVFFYDTNGMEVSRYSSEDARVGNILITQNTLESTDYDSGTAGFKIHKDGWAEFLHAWIGNFQIYSGGIKSQNYVAGSDGIYMGRDGNAEFRNVVVRGDIWIPYDSIIAYESGTDVFDLIRRHHLKTNQKVSDGQIITYSSLGIDNFEHAPEISFQFNYVPTYKAQYSGSNQSLRLRPINPTTSQFEVESAIYIEETGSIIQTYFSGGATGSITPKSGIDLLNDGSETINADDGLHGQDGQASGSRVMFSMEGTAPNKQYYDPVQKRWNYYSCRLDIRCWVGSGSIVGGDMVNGMYVDGVVTYITNGSTVTKEITVEHPSGTSLTWDCKVDAFSGTYTDWVGSHEMTDASVYWMDDFHIEELMYEATQGEVVALNNIYVDIEVKEK